LSEGERVAYGHGDLHLPLGWGDIPWERIIADCDFPEGVIFNLEMKNRYWYAVQESIEVVRGMAGRARVGAQGTPSVCIAGALWRARCSPM